MNKQTPLTAMSLLRKHMIKKSQSIYTNKWANMLNLNSQEAGLGKGANRLLHAQGQTRIQN